MFPNYHGPTTDLELVACRSWLGDTWVWNTVETSHSQKVSFVCTWPPFILNLTTIFLSLHHPSQEQEHNHHHDLLVAHRSRVSRDPIVMERNNSDLIGEYQAATSATHSCTVASMFAK